MKIAKMMIKSTKSQLKIILNITMLFMDHQVKCLEVLLLLPRKYKAYQLEIYHICAINMNAES